MSDPDEIPTPATEPEPAVPPSLWQPVSRTTGRVNLAGCGIGTLVSLSILAAVFLVGACPSPAQAADQVASPDPTDLSGLETAVLNARRAIRNGSFHVSCVVQTPEKASGKAKTEKTAGMDVTVACSFDFDNEESSRFDWSQLAPRMTLANNGKRLKVTNNRGRHIERIVLTRQEYFAWSPDHHSDGSKVYKVGGVAGKASDPEAAAYRSRTFDPRVIGLSPGSFFQYSSRKFDSLFPAGTPGTPVETSLEKGTLNERVVWKGEWRNKPAVRRIWVAPDEGYSIVKAELAVRSENGSLLESIECKNAYVKDAGIWFPEKITIRRRLNDQVVMQEDVTIKDARLNAGVDKSVFTLGALGMPRGTHVIDLRIAGRPTREWTGTELTDVSNPQAKKKR